jgi:hypothetical protein
MPDAMLVELVEWDGKRGLMLGLVGVGIMLVEVDGRREATVALLAIVGGATMVVVVEFCAGIGAGVDGLTLVKLLDDGSVGATIGSSVGGVVIGKSGTREGDLVLMEEGYMVTNSPIPAVKLLPK